MASAVLVRLYPAALALLLAGWIGLVFKFRSGLAKAFPARPRSLLLAGAVFIAALAARLWMVPHAHRVFFDELEHVNAAENLARHGGFGESLAGDLADFDVLAPPTRPGGFHLLLAALFTLAEPSSRAAFALNAVLGSLSILAVFLLSLRLWNSEPAALACALLLAALPLHLAYSGSADLSIASILWIALALTALEFYAEKPEFGRYLLLLGTLLYAANVRFENLLLLPYAVLALARRGLRPWRGRGPAHLAAHGAAALLLLPWAFLVWRNRSLALPGFSDTWLSGLSNLLTHLPANLAHLAQSPAGALSIALAAALLWSGRAAGRWREAAPLAGLSASYLAVYSSFFRGAFGAGTEDRYALSVCLPLVLLAGWAFRLVPPRAAALAAAVFALAGLREGRRLLRPPAPTETGWLAAQAGLIPRGAFIVAYSAPAALAAARRPAVSPYLLLEDDPRVLERLSDSPLVLWKDSWWRKRGADSARLEAKLLGRYAPEARPLAAMPYGGDEGSLIVLRKRPKAPAR